jgi:acid phosphatase
MKHVVLQHECQVTGCPAGTTGSSEIQIDWLTIENQSSPQPPGGVVPQFDHVFVVVEENHDYGQIIGSADAPYLNFLAGQGASATDYHGVAHPSLPDYLALIGGDTYGVTTDCSPADTGCSFATANLADRLEAAGLTWRGYFDGMPTPCRTTSSGGYRVHHNPFVYFEAIRNDAARCANRVRPLGDLATDLATASGTPTLALVVPDSCNDMHDCSIATGDAWLRRTLPAILDSPAWAAGNSLLIITFDEDAGTTGNGNRVAALFYGPSVRPRSAFTPRSDHYSLLRTLESAWSLPTLTANDAAAGPMDGIFRTTAPTDTIPPTVPGLPVANTPTVTQVDLAWSPSTDLSGVTGYEVYRDGAWLGSSATTSFTDATVLPGMTYTYRVRARDLEGNVSGYSALTTVTLPPPPPPTGAIQRMSVATVVNTVATNVVTIPAPTAVAPGDLLVACLALNGSGVATGGAPPGWTSIAAVTSISNPKVFGYYHVAGTIEPPSYAWTLSSAVVNGAGIARYTGANTTTPIDVPATSAAGATATTGTLPGVTTVTDGAMIAGCMAINSSSATVTIGSPAGMGEAWDLGGKRQELADDVQVAAGPSGPKTWTFSSGRDWAGWLVALRAR